MKTLKSSSLIILFVFASLACNAQTDTQDLQVYYFHFTKRCVTCNAVESETKIALEMFYSEQLKKGSIGFIALNLEEEDGKEMAQNLQVSGQTLMLVKGDNKVNLTTEGFMNARTKPDKFHEILKTQIDKLL